MEEKWYAKEIDEIEKKLHTDKGQGLTLEQVEQNRKQYGTNELKEKKNVMADIIYFPEILRELKGDWELYESRMKRYQTVDLLCIDDIGAEKVSEWSRDEVLGTILQTRMNHNLTTFFTSNLTLEELEKHFAFTDKSDERIKARRIMERIKQLTIDMELISENRRS